MQQITTALVLGANRYKVERQTGGYLYLLEPGDHENPDALALAYARSKCLMKCTISFATNAFQPYLTCSRKPKEQARKPTTKLRSAYVATAN